MLLRLLVINKCLKIGIYACIFFKQIFGEVYDVDSKMLAKLDSLEEHPDFYLRTEEDVLLASEDKIKSGETFEKV